MTAQVGMCEVGDSTSGNVRGPRNRQRASQSRRDGHGSAAEAAAQAGPSAMGARPHLHDRGDRCRAGRAELVPRDRKRSERHARLGQRISERRDARRLHSACTRPPWSSSPLRRSAALAQPQGRSGAVGSAAGCDGVVRRRRGPRDPGGGGMPCGELVAQPVRRPRRLVRVKPCALWAPSRQRSRSAGGHGGLSRWRRRTVVRGGHG